MTTPAEAPHRPHRLRWSATDQDMSEAGLPVEDVELVSIGGGLGSFALIDRLRLGGVSATDIRVVSPHLQPDHAFAAACGASGLADDDSLRSDSSARIDNIWGFPSYAAEEAWRRKRIAPLARVLLEPFCENYTPTVGLMRRGVEREAARIDWPEMVTQGVAERVVKRTDGGYFVVVLGRDGVLGRGHRTAYRCRFVHLALGASGVRVTSEAEEFREDGDHGDRLRHVYETHDHIYDTLLAKGGSVLVRGSGIAAATALERLMEAQRSSRHKIHIWQLFRHYQESPSGPWHARRDGGCGFTYQSYDVPKAAFTGQLRQATERLDGKERLDRIRELGATSTPYRRAWADQLRRGREEGWYDAVVGEVARFGFRNGKVRPEIRLANGDVLNLDVDHVLDATGLDGAVQHHPIAAELLADGDARATSLGGLRVDDGFSVVGCESGDGRIFASGMTARGASLAPVDSFSGLQSSALDIADQLAARGLGERLTPARSVAAWRRWMGGRKP